MGNSLFDQLNKTGLANKNKAKQTKKDKDRTAKKQQGSKKSNQVNLSSDSALRAQAVQAEQAQRDRELNNKQKQRAEEKAIAAQIIQLIQMNRVDEIDAEDNDIAFNFTDGKNIERIYVATAVHGLLSRGRLAIVRYLKSYALVPLAVAEKIQQRDPGCVVFSSVEQKSSNGDVEEDDLYAEFKVPDDLMW
jgi:uncharacterized protein YaiL (DUF2058 family)